MARSYTHVIASMDTGLDDALALAVLLADKTITLEAVVATYGNVAMPTAARNTRAVLELLGSSAPVYEGSSMPLWADAFIPDAGCATFHGNNGLGDVNPRDYGATFSCSSSAEAGFPSAVTDPSRLSVGGYDGYDPHANPSGAYSKQEFQHWIGVLNKTFSLAAVPPAVPSAEPPVEPPTEPPAATQQSKTAVPKRLQHRMSRGVQAIIDAVRTYRHEIAVLTCGPLTDLATALYFAPDIAPYLHVVAMAGAYMTPGNCYDGVCETNSIQDPEALDYVCKAGIDLRLIGLDVTHQCLLGENAVSALERLGNRGAFFAALAQFSIRANREADPLFAQGMPLHDPLAAYALLNENVCSYFATPIQVNTVTGDFQGVRGRTVGDPYRIGEQHSTRVALGVQRQASERILSLIEQACRG